MNFYGATYTRELTFAEPRLRELALEQSAHILAARENAAELKWLSALYAPQVRAGAVAALSVCHIDATVGYGVFARAPLSKGAYVGPYTGIVRSRTYFGRCYNHYAYQYQGFSRYLRVAYIDASQQRNELALVNHCDEANIEPKWLLVDGILQLVFFASCQVAAGQQLLMDYGPAYWERREKPANLRANKAPDS